MNKIDHLINVLVLECKKQNIPVLVSVSIDDEITVQGFGSHSSMTESVNAIQKAVVDEFEKGDNEDADEDQ
jgi:hypothetical protein